MQLIHDKALDTLGKFGLSVIQAVGEPFDPERHRAIMQQPSAEHPDQTVLQETRKVYQLGGRTIRPSEVIVSKTPEETDQPEQAAEETPQGDADHDESPESPAAGQDDQ